MISGNTRQTMKSVGILVLVALGLGYSATRTYAKPAGRDDVPLQSAVPSVAADSNDDLPTCEWVRNSSTVSSAIIAFCPESTQRVLNGACVSSGNAYIEDSFPFEGSFGSDLVDDGDFWYDVTGASGWYCGYDGVGNPNWALALCCGD
jgi:hypothetical protein